jgi:hypothetical protein
MIRTAATLGFADWLEYERYLCSAYHPLPRPGQSIRIAGMSSIHPDAWLIVDEDGYVRLASCELAVRLEKQWSASYEAC